MDVDSHVEVGMGKVLAGQLHQQALESIRAAVRQEVLEEVKAEAFEQAMAELDDRLQRERGQLRDEAARYKDQLDTELEEELERRTAEIRREVRDALEERLLTLQDDLTAAAAARDQASQVLVSLVTQLVVEKPKRYLADAGITALDLVALNQVLVPQGVQIRSEFRHSARQVTCKLKSGAAAQRTVFWRERAGPGVVEELAVEDDGPGGGEGGGEGTHTHTQG